MPIAATRASPFWSICAVHFWIEFGQLAEAAVRERLELEGGAVGGIVLLDAELAAVLAFVDRGRARVAVAEHDDPFAFAGQVVGERRGLGAVEDAGIELVLVDDVQAERVRLLLDALIRDDHRDALVQAALERLHQADALQ